MKNIAILGSTGSIGQQAFEVANNLNFNIKVLTAHSNIELLAEQAIEANVDMVYVENDEYVQDLCDLLFGTDILVVGSVDEIFNLQLDILLNSMVGAAGIIPTVRAIEAGIDIALANKETLVSAGDYVISLAKKKGVKILPVDSEHSAIMQCIEGNSEKEIEKIIITASGGPFFATPLDKMKDITLEDALKHPTWVMGKKITIDSATLMNKGLEVIEAVRLFDVSYKDIEVVVHPQSIIHSMVQYIDGSILAQLGNADMRIPIQYSFTHPDREKNDFERVDFTKLGELNFYKPDCEKFRCLKLAFDSLDVGGSMTAVLNASNEEAVKMFLDRKISFTDIPRFIEKVMDKHNVIYSPNLYEILEVDKWAREETYKLVEGI